MEIRTTPSRATTWFVLCSVVAMLYFAQDFLVPVALAVFVAFALAPFARRLERMRLPRVAATILTTASVGILAAGIGWLFVGELRDFVDQMPGYRENVRAKAADVRELFGETFEQASSTVRDLGHDLTRATEVPTGDPASKVAAPTPPVAAPESAVRDAVQGVLGSLAGLTLIAGLVFVLAFVMLLRWEDLRDRVIAIAGKSDLQSTTRAASEASVKISRYLRRQLLLNLIHGTAMGLALSWVGVPNPLVWGILGATLRFVPYLGPLASMTLPLLVSFASSEGWTQTWIAAGTLIALEIVSNNVLEPWIYGAATGISPFALLLSTAFWTWIWGPMGLVLATPLTVCLLVVGKRFPALRFLNVLFRDEPAYPRRVQLYHRLLADDQDEAWEILRQEIAASSLTEAIDRTLVPALALASLARSADRIDFEAREHIGSLGHGLVDEVGELPAPGPASPASGGLRALCFPARDTFDAVASRLLALALTRQGSLAVASEPEQHESQVYDVVRRGDVDVVIVSSVAPTQFLRIRALCKRLLNLDARVEILVGMWGEDMPVEEARTRLPDSPRVHLALTFADALAWLERKSTAAESQRTASA